MNTSCAVKVKVKVKLKLKPTCPPPAHQSQDKHGHLTHSRTTRIHTPRLLAVRLARTTSTGLTEPLGPLDRGLVVEEEEIVAEAVLVEIRVLLDGQIVWESDILQTSQVGVGVWVWVGSWAEVQSCGVGANR